jgi:hypothetical protein
MASNTLGTILIELKAKTDAFERGMKSAKDLSFTTSAEIVGSLERIGKSLLNLKFNNLEQMGRSLGMIGGIAAATGAALATSVVAVAIETSKKMVELGHDAEKAGMGIQSFTEFAYAAKRSGVDVETFTNAMSKLAKTAVASAQGNAQLTQALKQAGSSATDAAGRLRPTGDILTDIIKKYETLTDRTLKVGLAQQVFGRGGAGIIPFLEKGSQAIEQYRKQAEMLGVAFGPQSLASAKQFQGSLAQIKATSEGATIQLTAGLLPALNDVLGVMLKVSDNKSLMRQFGEDAGEAFRTLARSAFAAYIGIQQLKVALYEEPKAIAEKDPWWKKALGITGAKMIFGTDPESQKKFAALQKEFDDFVLKLEAGAVVGKTKEEGGKGTPGLNPEKSNYAAEEIAKLREKTQGTLALAAAELIGLNSVRATAAANQADAIILQIATKASKEHKTALEAEITAAQKKYGATVLALTSIEQEAQLTQALNKSISDQTRGAEVAIDAHRRMAEAVMQGGEAVTRASIANQIDALRRKDGIKLTEDQEAALKKLEDTLQMVASSGVTETLNAETASLKNQADATQKLIEVQGLGLKEEIQARAEIEATNFARQHNIDLTEQERRALVALYAAQGTRSVAQSTGSNLIAQYDPRGNYQKRIEEINAAVAANKNLTLIAEAAKRDAYIQEQEELDRVAMATQRGAAGAAVALRQWLRQTQNWAKTMHESVSTAMQGFDTGFRNAFSDVIMGTKTVGQAFAEMGRTMLRSVIDALAGIVAKWIETKIILATLKLFGVDMSTDDPMQKASAQISANAAEAESYAGLAAAEEFEWKIAESGDIFGAAAMGAVAYGIGASFAALAAFDNGGIMKNTGLALVHQDEGVLTGPTTKMLVNVNKMMNSPEGKRASGGASGTMPAMPMNIHINGAGDPDAVAAKVGDVVMARVKRFYRTAGVSR